ncbi:MAG: peptidoglycan bridge formation glycyltransferase FemA/FemB family protein [Candidatus Hodarchaeota archaeon]
MEAEDFHFGAFHRGELVAFISALKKTLGPVTIVNSNPFYGSHGGISVSSKVKGKKELVIILLKYFVTKCQEIGAASSVIIEPLDNKYKTLYLGISNPDVTEERIGQILKDISFDEEKMLTRYHETRKRNIRKAQRSDIRISKAENVRDSFHFLYGTHVNNMTAISGNPKPQKFFDLIPEYFLLGEDYDIYEAFLKKERIASLLVFYFNETVEYYTPVIVQKYRALQPMSLLIHTTIMDSAERGYKNFNFGGTWKTQHGLYNFKKKWGCSEVPYMYYINRFTEFELDLNDLLHKFKGFYIYPTELRIRK